MLINFSPQIDPRDILLGTWERWGRFAEQNAGDSFLWGDVETPDRNSVADAEMLTCLLLPGEVVSSMDLVAVLAEEDDGDFQASRRRLSPDGDDAAPAGALFSLIFSRASDYLEAYSGGEAHIFGAPSYLGSWKSDPEQTYRGPLVDGYSFAITVCLLLLKLLNRLEPSSANQFHSSRTQSSDSRLQRLQKDAQHRGLPQVDVGRVRELASSRLTAALSGLLNSFVAVPMNPESWQFATRNKRSTSASQGSNSKRLEFPTDQEMSQLRSEVSGFLQGIDPQAGAITDGQPWECGFSWGPVRNTSENEVPAISAVYLYFTVVALDGIRDVSSHSVMAGNILNDEQAALAAKLAFCARASVRYWARVALQRIAPTTPSMLRVGDLPWRTNDGDESSYYTLLVLRILVLDGEVERMSAIELRVIVETLEELSHRARLTRSPSLSSIAEQESDAEQAGSRVDPALELHHPGKEFELVTGAPVLSGHLDTLRVYDFGPQVLKIAARLARAPMPEDLRERLRQLIEASWYHLEARISGRPGNAWALWPPEGLWDVGVMRGFARGDVGEERETEFSGVRSWYLTERVVEAIVALAQLRAQPPQSLELTSQLIGEMVSQAEWMLGRSSASDRKDLHGEFIRLQRDYQGGTVSPANLVKAASELLDKINLRITDEKE